MSKEQVLCHIEAFPEEFKKVHEISIKYIYCSITNLRGDL